MPGINTTGKKNTADLTVGRGRLYASELDGNSQPTLGWTFLGNAPQMNISVETETLPHQDSTEGLKSTDLELTISQTVSMSLQLDELNFTNLAYFFAGETASYNNTDATGVVNGTGNLIVWETQGRWYDIYKGDLTPTGNPTANSSAERLYDIGVVTIKNAGDVTTYVEGVDYEVDSIMGRIFIIQGGAITGAATTGTPYNLDIAANASADVSVDEVRALTRSAVSIALKFIHVNANGDRETEYQFHQIKVKAEGDLAAIGDEYGTLGLQGVAEKNEAAGGEASPTLTIRTHANATAA